MNKVFNGETGYERFFFLERIIDLIEQRQKVRDTILRLQHFPVGMEMFNASDENQWNIIKETIECSDYYVLIIGVCDSLSCPNSALIFVRQLLISLPQLRLHFRGFLPRIYFTQ